MNNAGDVAKDRAESLEEIESFDELEYLEVKVTSGIDGQLQEIHVVTETGGPHVEINVGSETLTVNWEQSHTTHFNNEELANEMWNYFSGLWESANPR